MPESLEAQPQLHHAVGHDLGKYGWTVADVARRHEVTRQHIYQWRRELRRKGLWPETGAPVFLPVEMAPDGAAAVEPVDEATCEITIVLRNGLQLQCRGMIGDVALARLVRVLETT